MERFFPNDMPPPMADSETLPWWKAAAERRLVMQRCCKCSRFRHPPGPVCPECRSLESEWPELSGRGEIYTYTIVHRPIAAGQRDQLPFIVVVIDLDGAEKVRLISNLVGSGPEEVRIGLPVEVVWEQMSPDICIPRFRRA